MFRFSSAVLKSNLLNNFLLKYQNVSVASISGYIAILFTTDAFLGDILVYYIVAHTVQFNFCHIF